MGRPSTQRKINHLIEAVGALRRHCLDYEAAHAAVIASAARGYRRSARNLLHYLALRQHDIRALQEELETLGLSSLGRLEAHTLATLDAVLRTLHRLADRPAPDIGKDDAPVDFTSGPRMLGKHTTKLFGPPPEGRPVRIMVTLPSEAATDPDLAQRLVAAGMNVARINCAHDGPDAWAAMARHVRRAAKALGRPCRIAADLAGPKLRTGAIACAAPVAVIKPPRGGAKGQPARIWLTPAEAPVPAPAGASGRLLVPGGLLAEARVGHIVEIEEARGRERWLTVTSNEAGSCWAECPRTCHVAEGAAVILRDETREEIAHGEVGPLPPIVEPLVLKAGDTLLLTRGDAPGGPATKGKPARIPCSLDAVFASAKPGERVWLDDGAIGGAIRTVSEDGIAVDITYARPQGSKLRAEKGINLPDTALDVPAMTAKDLADLDAVFPLIDMVSLSFVRRRDDLNMLERRLGTLGGQHLGVIIKIENRAAFEQLPGLLFAALRSPPVGVMVARGDLAVEVGFGRLAEVQEEILWLCEAAHVPVIWATQVLEDLAKTGRPSRSEVTDAAMSGRAECVMLNKGPFVADAVTFLDGILAAMGQHQSKKSARLRRLKVSDMA